MGINYESTKRNHPEGRFLFAGCTLSATGAFILRENAVKTDAAGRSRTLPPLSSPGRIRTALQISNAERFYRNNSNAAIHKLGVS